MIVTCVKVGAAYGPEYVNRLAAMVARHTARPYRFLCLTDDATGVSCDTAHIGSNLPGWWAKLVLFRPHPALAGERLLYLDLDTVLVGNIDALLDYRGDFAILRDFYRPTGYGSAIMAFEAGWGQTIWEQFTRDPAFVMSRLHGDQEWIETIVEDPDLWQSLYPGLIGSYKAHGLAEGPKGFHTICFHGWPKPTDVDGWVRETWHE